MKKSQLQAQLHSLRLEAARREAAEEARAEAAAVAAAARAAAPAPVAPPPPPPSLRQQLKAIEHPLQRAQFALTHQAGLLAEISQDQK